MSEEEAVAKAIFEADDAGFPKFTRYPWGMATVAVRSAYHARARAAIARLDALRRGQAR